MSQGELLHSLVSLLMGVTSS